MIKVTLKDGVVKEYESGTTVAEVAKSLGAGLYKSMCACKINGNVCDVRTPLTEDCELSILTFDNVDGKKAFWHTTSHILAQAVKRGLTRVKFFPATAAGGIKMIKAMCAAYTNVRIMPTGGINTANLEEFLSCDKIFCCGGSWMVKGDMIKAGEFDKIKDMTAEAGALVKKIRG